MTVTKDLVNGRTKAHQNKEKDNPKKKSGENIQETPSTMPVYLKNMTYYRGDKYGVGGNTLWIKHEKMRGVKV